MKLIQWCLFQKQLKFRVEILRLFRRYAKRNYEVKSSFRMEILESLVCGLFSRNFNRTVIKKTFLKTTRRPRDFHCVAYLPSRKFRKEELIRFRILIIREFRIPFLVSNWVFFFFSGKLFSFLKIRWRFLAEAKFEALNRTEYQQFFLFAYRWQRKIVVSSNESLKNSLMYKQFDERIVKLFFFFFNCFLILSKLIFSM